MNLEHMLILYNILAVKMFVKECICKNNTALTKYIQKTVFKKHGGC